MRTIITAILAFSCSIGTASSAIVADPIFWNATLEPMISSKTVREGQLSSGKQRTTLSILASINYGGNGIAAGTICSKAIELALDRLRMQPNWLPNYDLSVEPMDDKCDDSLAIKNVASIITGSQSNSSRLPVVLISDCATFGQVTIAKMIKQLNYIGFTLVVKDNKPADRQKYSSLFPLIIEITVSYNGATEFMRQMGWRKLAIFSENLAYFNEIEKFLFKMLDDRNISVTWIGKVAPGLVDSIEVEQAVIEMKNQEPRIILSNTNSPVVLSCWLRKYGMYGPKFVIMASVWGAYNPDTVVIPAVVSSWCTRAMLRDIVESWVFFGFGNMRDIFGMDFKDSSGLAWPQFIEAMETKVVKATQNPAWSVWSGTCYDFTLFAGYVLNATEAILQRDYNSTLAEWTTGTSLFQEQGSFLAEVIKKAIYSIEVFGSKGDYNFSPKTSSNSLGYTPIVFTQMRYNNDSAISAMPVGYYKSSDNQVLNLNGGPRWRTNDKQPPVDATRFIRVALPPNSLAGFVVLALLASLGILFSATFVIALCFRNRVPQFFQNLTSHLATEDTSLLVGNAVMLSHIFTIPLIASTTITQNCNALAFLLSIGFSLSNFSFLVKLHHGLTALSSSNFKAKKFWIYGLVLWLLFHVALIALFLDNGAITLNVVNQPAQKDDTFTYLAFRYECFIDVARSNRLIGLIVALAGVNVALLLITTFETYQVRQKLKSSKRAMLTPGKTRDLTLATVCAYCQIIVLLAGALIGLTQASNMTSLSMVAGATTVCYTYISFSLLFGHKVFPSQVHSIDLGIAGTTSTNTGGSGGAGSKEGTSYRARENMVTIHITKASPQKKATSLQQT